MCCRYTARYSLLYYESAKSTSHKGQILLTQIKAIRQGVGGTAHSFSIDHINEEDLHTFVQPNNGSGGDAGGSGGSGDADRGESGGPAIYSLVCQASSDAARDEWMQAIRRCLEQTHKFKVVLLGESGAGKTCKYASKHLTKWFFPRHAPTSVAASFFFSPLLLLSSFPTLPKKIYFLNNLYIFFIVPRLGIVDQFVNQNFADLQTSTIGRS